MKPPAKACLVGVALLIGLPLVAWTGTFFYWQVRSKSAIRSVRDEALRIPPASGSGQESIRSPREMLLEAGCRALPYLVRAQREAETVIVADFLMDEIIECLAGPPPYSEEARQTVRTRMSLWIPRDPDRPRKAAQADFDNWWRENGDSYHQWWRIWSANCRAAQ